jgi:cytochrome c2
MRFATFLISIGLLVVQAAAQSPSSPSASESSAKGKKIFVTRCAKCHDENAGRKLPDGSNLLDLLARSQNVKARIATRIKNEDEQRAVAAYMAELIAQSR